jgi:hypothetical protein
MPKSITEELFCEFSQDEMDAKGQELSSTMLEYDNVESQKKDATKEFTDSLKELRGRMRSISKNIRRKGEARAVSCHVLFHVPAVGTKRIVRIDTGELVRDEPMSNDEMQENLFGEINDLERLYGQGPDDKKDDGDKK